MRIINVPIESIENRYSSLWNTWFPLEFIEEKVGFTTIYPQPLTDKITKGAFLDVCGTNYFKALQLSELCKKLYDGDIKDGDVIFFHDLWFPGIEMLAYIRDALGLKFKIAGCLHAGTYDPWDFLTQKGMSRWAHELEESWFEFYDAIFVATQFHKNLITENRVVDERKIHVTYFPIYPIEYPKIEKEDQIVFPHRLHAEKDPNSFDYWATLMEDDNWQWVKTFDTCPTRDKYIETLASSRIAVSFAFQETWGIAMQEAVLCDCIPLVPNKLSYPEIFPGVFRYDNLREGEHQLQYFMTKSGQRAARIPLGKTKLNIIEKGTSAISKMVKIMRSL